MRACLLLAGVCVWCALGQEKGIEPDWDIRPVLKEIATYAQRVGTVLDQIDPHEMLQKGAPDTYAAQLTEGKVQAKALATEALNLASAPEKLSADLETLFRLQSLERTVISIEEGIRKYQNPALADLLRSQVASGGQDRERFQRYIQDLAAEHEQEYQIMDHEAQRCRGILARQPKSEKK